MPGSCIIKSCAFLHLRWPRRCSPCCSCPPPRSRIWPRPPSDAPPPFDQWLEELIDEARQRGYSDVARRPDARRPDAAAAGHPERPRAGRARRRIRSLLPWHASTHASSSRDATWRARHRTLLSRLETSYERPAPIRARHLGHRNALSAASRAIRRSSRRWPRSPGNRAARRFFRGELFDALTMVSQGHIDAGSMTGSWAGAMGQPQFMPSSYLKYAEDFDGDGRTDIWRSTPDALASIANYLNESGWNDEFTWGREVRVTPAVRERIEQEIPRRTEGCFAMRNMTERIPLTEWQRLGVRRVDGTALPNVDVTAGLVTTDTRTFLVYENYDAILQLQLRALLRAHGRAARGSNSIVRCDGADHVRERMADPDHRWSIDRDPRVDASGCRSISVDHRSQMLRGSTLMAFSESRRSGTDRSAARAGGSTRSGCRRAAS